MQRKETEISKEWCLLVLKLFIGVVFVPLGVVLFSLFSSLSSLPSSSLSACFGRQRGMTHEANGPNANPKTVDQSDL